MGKHTEASTKAEEKHLIGIVSDTHGLLRPEFVQAFEGVDLIIHAGDVGGADVLKALEEIAPVVAVRGNMDFGSWAQGLHRTEVIRVGEALLYVLHDLDKIDLEPTAAGLDAVISGHTHQPAIRRRKGVLFINPGSAGPSRNSSQSSVALLEVEGNALKTRLVAVST